MITISIDADTGEIIKVVNNGPQPGDLTHRQHIELLADWIVEDMFAKRQAS